MGDRRLVLIVEDNDKNLKLARDVLQAGGFDTVEATTGEDAVRLAQERQPAAVVLDIHLPDIDGVQVLGRLRSDPVTAHIPAVAVTAYAMEGDRERLLDGGFDDYLSKPIDVSTFSASVADLIAGVGAGPGSGGAS